MQQEKDEFFMNEAIKEALVSYEEGEVPVGAVVIKDGEIIGRGHNGREKSHRIHSHAEINALEDASSKLGRWDLSDCSLYVTLEPCLMCAGAILQSRIRTVCFGAKDEKAGAIVSSFHVFDSGAPYLPPLLVYGICEEQCKDILRKFFALKRK